MKKKLGIVALGIGFLFTVLLTGCGGPNEKTVTTDFLRDHPTATVLAAVPGEGDSDNVYFQITYRLPDSAVDRKEVRLYQRDTNTARWKVVTRVLQD